jgi:hypothetical protein
MGMDADLGRHIVTALHVARKIDLVAKGLHVADEQDEMASWVQMAEPATDIINKEIE